MKILACWIGRTDLQAAAGMESAGAGPIAQTVTAARYDRILLLSDFDKAEASNYCAWLRKHSDAGVQLKTHKLSSPTNFGEIYEAAVSELTRVTQDSRDVDLTFHLSPGTPAMAAVWIILAKTRFPAELVESSQAHGVRTVSVPFDISAEFIPDLLRRPDAQLERLSQGLPGDSAGFEDIVHRSPTMRRVITQARRVAVRSLPILIEGESGTGKELLARAIHKTSPRKDGPFIAVNCGAIPPELLESEFFGHRKGAFTGATSERDGHFVMAHGGTLFLDEIGELPKAAQVKLLRVLQEKEVVPLGASKPIKVDTRIIAATNRNLLADVAAGAFREDLFYRLAVAIIKLPALRERSGDKSLLIDRLLARVNAEAALEPGYKDKKISAAAKNLMMQHPWAGNVRELLNTLQRAAVWTDDEVIGVDAMKEAMVGAPALDRAREGILSRPVEDGIDLDEILGEVARHYLKRAMDTAGGNKTKAAKLLGLSNYQTLTNWLQKYGVEQ